MLDRLLVGLRATCGRAEAGETAIASETTLVRVQRGGQPTPGSAEVTFVVDGEEETVTAGE